TGNGSRHALDDGITAGAIENLVVRTELVDVEQQQRDVGLVTLREREIALENVLEIVTRRETREPVLAYPVRQPADAGIARTYAGPALAVVTDEVRGLPLAVAQRIDLHVIDEHRAVLALVSHQHAHGLVVSKRFTQRVELLLVG